MLSLILDEPITPSMCNTLHVANIDAYHLRDRDLLGSADHEVWRRAKEEGRAVVTINECDFRELATTEVTHPGVVILPPYQKRDDQLNLMMTAVQWANNRSRVRPSFRDHFVIVNEDYTIRAELVVANQNDRPNTAKTIA